MKVHIDIGLDFEGNHTFTFTPSNAPDAVDVPHSMLERWASERDGFAVSYLRWKRVVEEIEDFLQRADSDRAHHEVAAAVAAVPARAR